MGSVQALYSGREWDAECRCKLLSQHGWDSEQRGRGQRPAASRRAARPPQRFRSWAKHQALHCPGGLPVASQPVAPAPSTLCLLLLLPWSWLSLRVGWGLWWPLGDYKLRGAALPWILEQGAERTEPGEGGCGERSLRGRGG